MAVAQLGPIHLKDSRTSVVKRLLALLREAKGHGATFVVFPELALTTFFPRYWMTDQEAIDRFFERSMPNADTQPLFDEARKGKTRLTVDRCSSQADRLAQRPG
jgi:predicted amidohydrolase